MSLTTLKDKDSVMSTHNTERTSVMSNTAYKATETSQQQGHGYVSDRFGRPIQESLLALLIYDDKGAGSTVAKLVAPEMFDGDYADIARGVIEYREKYDKAPKMMHVDDIFADIFTARTGRDVTYGDFFVHLLQLYDEGPNHDEGINTEFLLDTINEFIRFQTLKRVLVDSAEKATNLGEASRPDIDRTLKQYLEETDRPAGTGRLKLSDPGKWEDEGEQSSELTSGVNALDILHANPLRGTVTVLLGGLKAGKTHFLTNVAVRNALRRKRVLFVTCEMTANAMHGRLTQRIHGGARYGDREHVALLFEGEGEDLTIVSETVVPRFASDDPKLPKRLKELRTVITHPA